MRMPIMMIASVMRNICNTHRVDSIHVAQISDGYIIKGVMIHGVHVFRGFAGVSAIVGDAAVL